MDEPCFSIGEKALLESQEYPECSGPVVILDSIFVDFFDNLEFKYVAVWCYALNVTNPNGGDWWQEGTLRKEYSS